MEPATEKEDREDTDEKDQCATSHLIDRYRGVQKPDVHELKEIC
jgi:hypothetical protein